MNSRKQLLKKRKENVEPTETKLDFETALKKNPQKFVKYMYFSQKKVCETKLAMYFDSIKNVKEEERAYGDVLPLTIVHALRAHT